MTNSVFDPYLADILTWHQLNTIPTALYIHLPWCVQKCPYCDFNSHGTRGHEIPEAAYTQELIGELERAMPQFHNRSICSVFFGGGTPSLFAPKHIATLITYIKQHFATVTPLEITLEANPGTTDQENFSGYFDAGVNRISLGIQSFNAKHLTTLGRIHGPDQAHQAVIDAKQAGFKRVNIDLMFGLPQQSISEALADLTQAIDLNTGHISWYELTIEPNTAFAQKRPKLPQHDAIAEMTEQGHKLLQAHKFEHLEISAFAQPGHACRHNVHVWQFGDYLGIGAGAHSKLTQQPHIQRSYRHYHPKQYLAAPQKCASNYNITQQELPFEYLLNRLRIHRPICHNHFYHNTQLQHSQQLDVFQQAITENLIKTYANQDWCTTRLGQIMHNELLMLCMPDEL